jgi:hypothetical protein
MLPTKFWFTTSFGQTASEERFFFKSTNQIPELPVAALIVNGSELIEESL